MANFPNTNENNKGFYDGEIGKTHTNLVVSEGNAPHEKMIVSKTNTAKPFIYEYGPEGNQTVILAKGKIVEAAGVEYDREYNHFYTAVRQAEEDSETVLGVNHHNVQDQRRDAMEGNTPVLITRNVIEVPLFEAPTVETAAAAAEAMHFGAAYGVKDIFKPGDYVVAGKAGNFKLYEKGTHNPLQIVGQVWGASRELPPGGFLQYYNELESSQIDAYIKQISTTPTPGGDGYPYGAPYSVKGWKKEFEKGLGINENTGIPFLTDGHFSAEKRISATLDDVVNVEAVRPNDEVTVTGKDVVSTAKESNEAAVFVKLKHKLNLRKLDSAKVTYEDAGGATIVVPTKDVHLDVKENTVVIFFEKEGTFKNISIEVDAIVNPVAGIPTEWDYAGSVGALRILLQK